VPRLHLMQMGEMAGVPCRWGKRV